MQALNDLITKTLKWENAADFFGLFLIVAVALFVILLITLIAVAACHGKNKKKFKKLQAELDAAKPNGGAALASDNELRTELEQQVRAELEPQIRDELEPQIREQVEAELKDAYSGEQTYAQTEEVDREQIKAELRAEVENDIRNEVAAEYAAIYENTADGADPQTELLQKENSELRDENAELKATVEEKNKRIDELGELLMQNSSDHKSDNGELYVRINELNRENTELTKQVNELQTELAKAQAAKPAPKQQKASPDVKFVRPDKAPKPSTPKTSEPDDDDDEVINDYADANATVKVTLKYDRNKSSWVIYRSDIPTRAYRRIGTKQEALVVAKDLAKRMHCPLVVHKKDGKFQKT